MNKSSLNRKKFFHSNSSRQRIQTEYHQPTINKANQPPNQPGNMVSAIQLFISGSPNWISAKAVHKLVKLIDHKNLYGALQSSLAVINLVGLGSTDTNVELNRANIRNGNAEAEILEQTQQPSFKCIYNLKTCITQRSTSIHQELRCFFLYYFNAT